jgi:hypothetical protein
VLRPLVSAGFQVLFTRLIAVLFIVQSPYSFTIGHRGVFSLGRWAARFHAEFHELRATLVRLSTPISPYAYGTITRCGRTFQTVRLGCFSSRRPQPRDESRFGLLPFSLAATSGIDVSFCSCGYLDVSVPRVRSYCPMRSGSSDWVMRPDEFPHSEIHGSTPVCRLTVAYRRLQRPSSPLDAKTSTLHP